jgi:hypothetical protein
LQYFIFFTPTRSSPSNKKTAVSHRLRLFLFFIIYSISPPPLFAKREGAGGRVQIKSKELWASRFVASLLASGYPLHHLRAAHASHFASLRWFRCYPSRQNAPNPPRLPLPFQGLSLSGFYGHFFLYRFVSIFTSKNKQN